MQNTRKSGRLCCVPWRFDFELNQKQRSPCLLFLGKPTLSLVSLSVLPNLSELSFSLFVETDFSKCDLSRGLHSQGRRQRTVYKIWGFHGGDYEEWCVLGCHTVWLLSDTCSFIVRFEVFAAVTMKNAVFWYIKTQFVPHRRHYISATVPSQLMLCKIWGFHGVDYKDFRLLGCYVIWLL
jgi:hypothetical protein